MRKNILITGTGKGLGKQIAHQFGHEHDLILHHSTSKEGVEEIEGRAKGKIWKVQADLSKEGGTKKIADFIGKEIGSLDAIIHNAGHQPPNSDGKDLSWEMMQSTFSVNCFSPLSLTLLCRPFLKKGTNPCVILMSSLASRLAYTRLYPEYYEFLVYSSSKGAVDVLTKGLAQILAPDVRVNSIAPGIFKTGIHKRFLPDSTEDVEKTHDEMIEKGRQMSPLQRIGDPRDINLTIQFLMENAYMTGACIDLNGGIFMR